MKSVYYYNETEEEFITKLRNFVETFRKNSKEGHVELSRKEYKRFKKLVKEKKIFGAELNILAWPTVMGVSIIRESQGCGGPW